MSLRRRTLLIMGVVLTTSVVLLFVASQVIFLNSYLELETARVQLNLQRVLNSLDSELQNLSATAADWAYGNDIYQYMQQGNPNYIQTNVSSSTFTNLKVNAILFVNSQGTLVFGEAFDLANNHEQALDDSMRNLFAANSPLLSQSDIHNSIMGIVMLSGNPALVASRAILTSDEQGPRAGTLIVVRYLDSAAVTQIANTTQLTVNISRLDDPNLLPEFRDARTALSPVSPMIARPIDENRIAGYTLLNDIYRQLALLVRIDTPRTIYSQGQRTISYFLIAVLLIGTLLSVIVVVVLERQVLSRIARLSGEVNQITTSNDPAQRVTVNGQDELASLSDHINRMLEAIQESHTTLRGNQTYLRNVVKKLEQQNQQLQRITEFFRSTVKRMSDSVQYDGSTDELLKYLQNVETQLERMEQSDAE